MKKMIFLMLLSFLGITASMNAQVNIGSPDAPHKGAVLDLSKSSSESGVLLPRVYIFNAKQFQLATDEGTDPTGMLVYNTNSGLPDGVGLYAWNGSEWRSMIGDSRCVPVTATSTFSTTGMNAKITVTVSEGTPNFSYTWYKGETLVKTTANVSTNSDNFTTTGAGSYTCRISNPCTVTPVSLTFTVDASGETLIDNGNGTFTDKDGNLVYNGKTYTPVESDIPGVYLDEADEIVYTGADGIPGTPDDDTYVIPEYPLPKQETLFSMLSPRTVFQNGIYPIQLDFADGPGSYTGKIKYLSSNTEILSIDADGVMTAGPTNGMVATVAIILEDGSILSSNITIQASPYADGNKLETVLDNVYTLKENSVNLIGVSLRDKGNSVNVRNVKSTTYTISNAGGTGSTITESGWFHAGTAGIVTVTATIEAYDSGITGTTYTKTGTITVTIQGNPAPEEQPYVTASTNWNTLDPAPAYAGGNGSASNPYQISSVRQLKKLATDISLLSSTDATYQKYFELTTDLDFSADGTVIQSLIGSFYGTLDGKGHLIKNLNIDATGKGNVSVFSALYYGEIKNLGREGGRITDTNSAPTALAAGLVAVLSYGGKLSNCYNSSSFIDVQRCGGLVYDMRDGSSIENCYNIGNITSQHYIGGLVGSALVYGGTISIKNSYNSGDITASNRFVGGLIGVTNGTTNNMKQILNMNNCFNLGDVTMSNSRTSIGSILGCFSETSTDIVEVNTINVYSRPGAVTSNGGTIINQPLGWNTDTAVKDAVLAANPTMGEDAKYTVSYSKTSAFAAELGSAFKYANGRTPKLAWEK